MSPSAKIVADSISPDGVRLTTMEVVIHRFVLAEFNTHRVFSRNSASSRAIPVSKQIERVEQDLAWPVSWPSEQKGMQGGKPLDAVDAGLAKHRWQQAATSATLAVKHLTQWAVQNDREALHKSVANRLLEPFMWHTVVVTSTAWENFFALRTDADAQPEIRQAAVAMEAAYREHQPTEIGHGNWHLPYLDEDTIIEVSRLSDERHPMPDGPNGSLERHEAAQAFSAFHYGTLARISAARCARVSYLTHDGKRDYHADLDLYDRLITDRVSAGLPVHWSPLEHVATPWNANRQAWSADLCFTDTNGQTHGVATQHLPRVGNLLGWRSMRTTVETFEKERTYR